MDEPPFLIDGAQVLRYAALDPAPGAAAARSAAVASGVPLHTAAGLIIAENLADGAIYLLFCDRDWATLGAESQPDIESAARAAEAAFPGVEARWRPFRAHSAAESAEIETTRGFLRDLARDFPDEP